MIELSSKVRSWLDVAGFPLEMKAAAAFREAGFEVRQSSTYEDPLSEKSREIDVLANDPDFFGFVDLAAVVECKSSPNPWVVLTAQDVMEGHNLLRARAVYTDRAYVAMARNGANTLKVKPFLHQEGRCGYALRQAFSKGNDPGYEAAMAVVSACKGIYPPKTFGGWDNAAAALPIIVVNAPIFECELQVDGDLKLIEVEQSDFLFSARLPHHVVCSIRIAHIDAVADTARWAKRVTDAMRQDLREEESRIIEELDQRAKRNAA